MSLRRVGWLAAIALAAVIEISCGQVYRPVVIPTSTTPPNPSGFHAVFGISTNVAFNPGTAMQIDVAGDTNIGVANMGVNPTHATALPNNSRIFVTSSGSLFTGDADVVMAFTPASDSTSATGLGTPVTFSLPYGSLPVFVNTTQGSTVYVANYGTNSVSALNAATDVVSLTGGVGTNPVALAETPNALNLYVVNQGDNTVTDLSPIDLSTIATIPVGATPVWAVSRVDSQRVYVLTQGGGQLVPIDTTTNTVLQSQTNLSVGAGANFLLYDAHLDRLYVTNPSTGNVYVFSASGGTDPSGTPNDTPTLLGIISMTAGTTPLCPNGCSPVSVTAMPDGSRFYVASYEVQTPVCSDPNVGPAPCIIPRLTVFDTRSLTVKPVSSSLLSPSLSLLTQPGFAATQYAVPPVSSCAPAATYTPASTRFRMFTTAAADSSHVYASICDAGSIADINATTSTITTGGSNTPDVLVADLNAPFGLCTNLALCGPAASISSFSIASNVVTFAAANSFVAGQKVAITGLTTGTYLNGLTLTVLPAGLSASQFECYFSHADVTSTSDAGTATPAPPTQTPIFLLSGQ
jgi:YVTN family beta-propeller protein